MRIGCNEKILNALTVGLHDGSDFRLPCHLQVLLLTRVRTCRQTGGEQQVEITLKGDECSDFLNFVIKDASTGTWYDFYRENFHVPLRLALTSLALDESMDEEISIPESQLPELPGELTGIWAYIKWEFAGCPNRSQQESDAEYRRGIQV